MNELRPSVTLEELSEDNLRLLLDAAVADADPLEVMAAVDGPPGWTPQRRQVFVEFHRGRALHPTRPMERTFVITVDGRVIGAARLEPHGDDVEAGIWIGRSHRNRGVGGIVTAQLRTLAAESGAHRITAATTPRNIAARRLIDTGLQARVLIEGDAVTGIADLT
ncbi:GNAT family N-acetyltransferase [Nocardia sp. GCM10030253]|uniref:GNAT family N-acetyltransferase n=1 Tax=Nocardia sp. GCM10030253 TaxID=3273404 RepID=UPI00363BDCCC